MGLKIELSYVIGGLVVCLLLISGTATAKEQKSLIVDKELKRAYMLLFPLNTRQPYRLKKKFHKKENARKHAIVIAKKQISKKYRWGGSSPITGFDCSGLMQYAFKTAKVNIPRTAKDQYKHTKRISLSKIKAGDLIFFHTRRTRVKVNHVGLYLGDGKFIHAPRRGKTISVENLNRYWRRKAVGAGRV